MIGSSIRKVAIHLIYDLMKRLEDFEHNGSGYNLQEIVSLDLEVFNFSALKAGCGKMNLRNIEQKSQLLSVKNNNQYCLLYSIAAAFTRRLYSYSQIGRLRRPLLALQVAPMFGMTCFE